MNAEPPVPPAPELAEAGEGLRRLGRWLGPVAFAALLFWPGLGLTETQRRAAAVMALTAILWLTEAVPVGVSSLLPAALFPLLGVMSAEKVAPAYFKDIVLLFLGAMLLALGLERWGLHRRLALFVLARAGGRPRRLVLGFAAATALLSMWLNNTATALLMIPIAEAVASRFGGARNFRQALLLAVAYAASIGGMGTPVGTAPNQVFLGQFRERYPDAPPIAFGQWMLGWTPLVLLWIPIAGWLLTRGPLRVADDAGPGAEVVREERARLGRMSRGERSMALVFAVTALLWITRADLVLDRTTIPGWERLFAPAAGGTGGSRFAAGISDATVAVAMALVCFFLPAERGAPGRPAKRLLDWSDTARMPWDVLLLIGAGFCLADGVRASGLDELLGARLGAGLSGLPDWGVVLAVTACVALFSEIASNTATAQVLLPVLAAAAEAAGRHPLLTMAPAAIAASIGFMLPVATPPNALAFATRAIPARTMGRVGFWMDLVAIALVAGFFQLWVRHVWHVGAELPSWAGGAP